MANRLNLQDLAKRSQLTPRRSRADVFVRPVQIRASRPQEIDFSPLISGMRDLNEAENALEDLKAAENAQVLSADEEALEALDAEIREATAGLEDPEEREKKSRDIWFKYIAQQDLPAASHPRTLKHLRILSANRLSQQFSVEANAFIQNYTREINLEDGAPSVEEAMGQLRAIRAKYTNSSLIQGSFLSERAFAESSQKTLSESEAAVGTLIQKAKDDLLIRESSHTFTTGNEATGLMGFTDLMDGFDDDEARAAHQAAFDAEAESIPQAGARYARSFRKWVEAKLGSRDVPESVILDVKEAFEAVGDMTETRKDGSKVPLSELSEDFEGSSASLDMLRIENLIEDAEQAQDDALHDINKATDDSLSYLTRLLQTSLAAGSPGEFLDPGAREELILGLLQDENVQRAFEGLPASAEEQLMGELKVLAQDLAFKGVATLDRNQSYAVEREVRRIHREHGGDAAREYLSTVDPLHPDVEASIQTSLKQGQNVEAFIEGRLTELQPWRDVQIPSDVRGRFSELMAEAIADSAQEDYDTLNDTLYAFAESAPAFEDQRAADEAFEALIPETFGERTKKIIEVQGDNIRNWEARSVEYSTMSREDLEAHIDQGLIFLSEGDPAIKAARGVLTGIIERENVAFEEGLQEAFGAAGMVRRAVQTAAEFDGSLDPDALSKALTEVSKSETDYIRQVYRETAGLGATERREERARLLSEYDPYAGTVLEQYASDDFEAPQIGASEIIQRIEEGETPLGIALQEAPPLPKEFIDFATMNRTDTGRSTPWKDFQHREEASRAYFALPETSRTDLQGAVLGTLSLSFEEVIAGEASLHVTAFGTGRLSRISKADQVISRALGGRLYDRTEIENLLRVGILGDAPMSPPDMQRGYDEFFRALDKELLSFAGQKNIPIESLQATSLGKVAAAAGFELGYLPVVDDPWPGRAGLDSEQVMNNSTVYLIKKETFEPGAINPFTAKIRGGVSLPSDQVRALLEATGHEATDENIRNFYTAQQAQ